MQDPSRPTAVVVGVHLPELGDDDFESSLTELERLASTLGLKVVGRVTQRRDTLSPAAVLGEGKLRELADFTGGSGKIESSAKRRVRRIDRARDDDDFEAEDAEHADLDDEAPADADAKEPRARVVLVDHELTPSQARNLERATGAEVLDRTSVILSIFQRHARTREARLQVELARLAYQAPRLREQGAGGDRVRGGVGGKGAGESALELDRRKIRDRMAELRRELADIARDAGTRRTRRSEANTVALVGYTNAGKSSLMRAFTSSEVLVEDKLFATLDTTVRALQPETRPRILVSDTVGFINKLPHDLVASFRSTLEEARDARLLLHVVDASDPGFARQLAVTREVLHELEADRAPSLLVMNKCDRLSAEARAELELEYPDAIFLSAKDPADVARLHGLIRAHFEQSHEEAELFVPWGEARLGAAIHAETRVLAAEHEAGGTRFRVIGPAAVVGRLRAEVAQLTA